MRHLCVITASILVFFLGPGARAQDWQELGPAPATNTTDNGGETSKVSALVVSPSDSDRYFVGGAAGGVWRTTDGGQSWSPLTDRLPSSAIGALALDPSNENIIYAGSGESNNRPNSLYGLGLYKSVNGGNSWEVLATQTFAGRTFSRLAVSSQNGNLVWAAVAPAGIDLQRTGREAMEGARQHPRRNGRVGIFRSRDAGQTWTAVASGLPPIAASDVVLDPQRSSRVYVAFGDAYGDSRNGVYRSTDGGSSFTRVLAPEPDADGRIFLAMAPSDHNRLYALIARFGQPVPGSASTRGFYRSDDGGDSWTQLSPTVEIHEGLGANVGAIIVHPTDPDLLFVAGNSLFRSRNGGLDLTKLLLPIANVRRGVHALAIDPAGNVLVATNGGVFRSSDQGDSWQARNNRLGLTRFNAGLSVHASDPNLIVGGTGAGSVVYTGNGLEWRRIIRNIGGYTTIHPNDPGTILAQTPVTGSIFRFFNGRSPRFSGEGITIAEHASFLSPMLLDPQDPNRILYASHLIYETNDHGNTWQAISEDLTGGSPAGIRALAIAPSNSNTVYATTTDGRLLTSTDGGHTFPPRLDAEVGWALATRQIAVDPLNDRRAYVAIGRFGGASILATTDRGLTWGDIGQGLPNRPVNALAVHRRGSARFIFAGTDSGVWLSSDNGASWSEYGQLPRSPVQDLVVDTFHDRLLATTLGRGAWSTSLPTGSGGGPGPGGCQEPLGSGRFCSACGPCSQGEGDCDNDAECQTGLSCAQNVGADFGFPPAVDVCVDGGGGGGGPSTCPVPQGNGRFCTVCGPCGPGEGDCDNNAECQSGLTCAQNVGADFGFPPAVDVCIGDGGPAVCPLPAGNGRFCTECGPCGQGQGDCDNDAECQSGLICAQNVGADFGFPPAVDVCVASQP